MIIALILSSLIIICSSNWLIIWISLEINSLAIGFIISNESNINIFINSPTFVYFLIQVLSSLVILLSTTIELQATNYVIIICIVINIGVWPVHSWYLNTINYLPLGSSSIIIIITWQNIIPAIILSYFTFIENTSTILIVILLITIVTPSINLNNTSQTKSVFILSSVIINSWLLVVILSSINSLFILLSVYFTTLLMSLIFFTNNNNNLVNESITLTTLLIVSNLGGLPPLPIFWANVIVLNNLIICHISSEVCTIIIIVACLFIYNYLTICNNQLSFNINNNNSLSITNHSITNEYILGTTAFLITILMWLN